MIKFPRVHIAESVTSRILDVRDELERGSPLKAGGGALDVPPPVVPDPAPIGEAIDLKANLPPDPNVPPLEPPPEPPSDELAGIVARGDDLITA
jgi:hypothetical protein